MNVQEGTWEDFEAWLRDLRVQLGDSASRLLFRGQGSSDWTLATTLERSGQSGIAVGEYYRLISLIAPAVQAFTGINAPEFDWELAGQFRDMEAFFESTRFPSGRHFEYMVYLRHHGFPSPLLDWSQSPYVATFFAFRERNPQPNKRSVYAYCETTGVKGVVVGAPMIRTLGPYVRCHPRHFRQQSTYTVCESFDEEHWHYNSHQRVFQHSGPEQDFLWRFDIPSQERVKALRLLNEFNLNAYSLFDSEETLLESLWNKEHFLIKSTHV
jgi:hypothetical protein